MKKLVIWLPVADSSELLCLITSRQVTPRFTRLNKIEPKPYSFAVLEIDRAGWELGEEELRVWNDAPPTLQPLPGTTNPIPVWIKGSRPKPGEPLPSLLLNGRVPIQLYRAISSSECSGRGLSWEGDVGSWRGLTENHRREYIYCWIDYEIREGKTVGIAYPSKEWAKDQLELQVCGKPIPKSYHDRPGYIRVDRLLDVDRGLVHLVNDTDGPEIVRVISPHYNRWQVSRQNEVFSVRVSRKGWGLNVVHRLTRDELAKLCSHPSHS